MPVESDTFDFQLDDTPSATMNGNGKREREAAGEEEVSSLEEEIANILQVFRDVTTVATDCPEESLRLFKQLNNVVESLNKIDSHRHLDVSPYCRVACVRIIEDC